MRSVGHTTFITLRQAPKMKVTLCLAGIMALVAALPLQAAGAPSAPGADRAQGVEGVVVTWRRELERVARSHRLTLYWG